MIKARIDVHLARKLTHIFGIFGMVLIHHFSPLWLSWIVLLGIGIPFLTFDFLRQRSKKLNEFTPKIFGLIMRRGELNSFAGTTYLLIGAIIILFFFPHNIVSISLLFLAFADPIASYVGIKYGTLKILGKKTFEGTLAAFIVCTILALFFYNQKGLMLDHYLVVSLLSGFVGCLTELIPIGKLDDNFTQPVANSLILYGLFSLYGGFA